MAIPKATLAKHVSIAPCFYELIERMYPRASKLELFARGPARPGWTSWGNQAEPRQDNA